MFHDVNKPAGPLFKVFGSTGIYSTASGAISDPTHRKVIQYVFDSRTTTAVIGDSLDDTAVGHGTHVVGTAVGSMYCLPSATCNLTALHQPFQGMAPGAKVAFFDVGRNGYGAAQSTRARALALPHTFARAH